MDKTCLTCLHGCDNCPPSDMPRACHGCDMFSKWAPNTRTESVKTTVSLRDAIKRSRENLGSIHPPRGPCGEPSEEGKKDIEAFYLVLEAATAHADAIDAEDPEGMQDRTCETCKYEWREDYDDPCIYCTRTSADSPPRNWEPKEDA